MTEAHSPSAALSPTELDALARQLQRLAAAGGGIPRLPFGVLEALSGLAPLPVVELCIVNEGGAVLLTWREDAHWRGWHFPGGFMAPGEGVAEACARIAARELEAVFVLEGVAGVEAWPAHPYASPVALLCRGTLSGSPSAGRFFATPPPDLIGEQRTYFESLATGVAVMADRMRD
jgi:hypothetical protein